MYDTNKQEQKKMIKASIFYNFLHKTKEKKVRTQNLVHGKKKQKNSFQLSTPNMILFVRYYTDSRTNPFEERENDENILEG